MKQIRILKRWRGLSQCCYNLPWWQILVCFNIWQNINIQKKQETNEKRNSEGTEPCSLSQEEFMNQGKNSSWEKYLFRIGYKMYVFNRVGLSFREGNGTPLQYSCLENPMDRGAWWAYSPWNRWGSDTTQWLHFHFSLSCIGEGNGNPLQCSCLENPRYGGAWWAAIYGVTQSRTRLKWLSSSSNQY